MNNVRGKVVFVTGGASGIGGAITKLLIENEARVFIFSHSSKWEKSDSVSVYYGDVGNESNVQEAFGECLKVFGTVDVLINNAGIGLPSPDLSNVELGVFEKMVDTNMKGIFLCNRESLKVMKEKGRGHIISIISMAGQRTNPNAPIYCASKFGARGLMSGLADQVVKLGIKITDINPGPVNTNYWGDRQVPREKFLSSEDVARVVLFVLNQPDYMMIREINFDNIEFLKK